MDYDEHRYKFVISEIPLTKNIEVTYTQNMKI
jgi:hypothetical protein